MHHLKGRKHNTQFLLYQRSFDDKIFSIIGLSLNGERYTRRLCYKTEVFVLICAVLPGPV